MGSARSVRTSSPFWAPPRTSRTTSPSACLVACTDDRGHLEDRNQSGGKNSTDTDRAHVVVKDILSGHRCQRISAGRNRAWDPLPDVGKQRHQHKEGNHGACHNDGRVIEPHDVAEAQHRCRSVHGEHGLVLAREALQAIGWRRWRNSRPSPAWKVPQNQKARQGQLSRTARRRFSRRACRPPGSRLWRAPRGRAACREDLERNSAGTARERRSREWRPAAAQEKSGKSWNGVEVPECKLPAS